MTLLKTCAAARYFFSKGFKSGIRVRLEVRTTLRVICCISSSAFSFMIFSGSCVTVFVVDFFNQSVLKISILIIDFLSRLT
jgi:hypothetical protein